MLKNFIKIISLIFLFIYLTPVYSKKIDINEFNSKDLSNYFSAIISYDNQKNDQALKFFNLSKPELSLETAKTLISEHVANAFTI